MTTPPMPRPGWYPDPSGSGGQRYFDGTEWTAYAPPPPPPPSVVINNRNVVRNKPTLLVASGPNHALHLILTLLTCGMWLPVWIIVAIVNRPGVRTAKGGSGVSGKTVAVIGAVLGGLMLLGFVSQHPVSLIPLAVLAGVGYLGYQAYERAINRRKEQAKIASRAEAQHRATMSGDPSGLYGQYPPPPIPDDQR